MQAGTVSGGRAASGEAHVGQLPSYQPLVSPPSGLGFCYRRTPWVSEVADVARFWELDFSEEKAAPCLTSVLHLSSQGGRYLGIGGH